MAAIEMIDPFASLGQHGGYDSGATTAHEDDMFTDLHAKPFKAKGNGSRNKGKNGNMNFDSLDNNFLEHDVLKNDVLRNHAFVETEYQGWSLGRAQPLPGEKASWARTNKQKLLFNDSKLAELSKKTRKATGKGPLHMFAHLSDNQQAVVNRLLRERQDEERNRNAEWVIDCVRKEFDKTRGWMQTKECIRLIVIFKRQDREAGKAGHRRDPRSSAAWPNDNIIDLKDPFVEVKKTKHVSPVGQHFGPRSSATWPHENFLDLQQPLAGVKKTNHIAPWDDFDPVVKPVSHVKAPKQGKQPKNKGHGQRGGPGPQDMFPNDPLMDPFAKVNVHGGHHGDEMDMGRAIEVPMPPPRHHEPLMQPLHHGPQAPLAQHAQHQHHPQQQPQHHSQQMPHGPMLMEHFPGQQQPPHGGHHQMPPMHAGQQQPMFDERNNPFTPFPQHNNANLYQHPPNMPRHDEMFRTRSMTRLGLEDEHEELQRRRSMSREARRELKGVERKVERYSGKLHDKMEHYNDQLNDRMDEVLEKIDSWQIRGDDSSDGSHRDRGDFWSNPSISAGTPGTSPPGSPYMLHHRDGTLGHGKTTRYHRDGRRYYPQQDRRYTEASIIVSPSRGRRLSHHDEYRRHNSRHAASSAHRPKLIHAKTLGDYPNGLVSERMDGGYYEADFADRGRRRRQSNAAGYWDEEPGSRVVYVEKQRGDGRRFGF